MNRFTRVGSVGLLALLVLAGCQRETMRYEEIPKRAPHSEGELSWTLPASWVEVPPGNMQRSKFKINHPRAEGVDVSIAVLPSQMGSELANVNRWRGQLQLAPIDEPTWARSRKTMESCGMLWVTLSIESTEKGAAARGMRVAMTTVSGQSWFFKIMGPSTGVRAESENFDQFIKGVRAP